MAIDGLTTNEVTPYPLWNMPMPASQQKKAVSYSNNYDERTEVLPTNKIESKNFSDILMGTKSADLTESEYSFWDFVDIINPMQHIPVVSSVYRYMTGDEIKGSSRILGGGLYGGPIGMLAGGVNAAIAQTEGDDIGGTVMTAMFGKPEQDRESGKVPDTETAEVLTVQNTAPISISRFDSSDLDKTSAGIKKADESIQKNVSSAEVAADSTSIPADTNKYVYAQASTGDSQWQAFYNHQMNMEKQKIDELGNTLASDTYEKELMLEAERQAIAEQNKILLERENTNKARIAGINRLKEISQQKEFEQAEAMKPPPETDKYGFRPSAGLYGTGE